MRSMCSADADPLAIDHQSLWRQCATRARGDTLESTVGALTNRVLQPLTLVVLGLNAGMGTAAGADALVEIPYRRNRLTRTSGPFSRGAGTILVLDLGQI